MCRLHISFIRSPLEWHKVDTTIRRLATHLKHLYTALVQQKLKKTENLTTDDDNDDDARALTDSFPLIFFVSRIAFNFYFYDHNSPFTGLGPIRCRLLIHSFVATIVVFAGEMMCIKWPTSTFSLYVTTYLANHHLIFRTMSFISQVNGWPHYSWLFLLPVNTQDSMSDCESS